MRRLPRKLLTMLALALVLLALAWAAFPAWAPWLAGHLLPGGWQIERLDTGRPGLEEVRARSLKARGQFGPLRVVVEAGGVVARYTGPSLTMQRLRIELVTEPAEGRKAASLPLDLDELSIPRLPLPGDMPDITIGRLELDTDPGEASDILVVDELRYGSDTRDSGLRADIGQVPLLAGGAVLRVTLTGDAIELSLSPADRLGAGPAVTYRQEVLSGAEYPAGTGTQSSLLLDLDLGLLDVAALATRLQAMGLGAVHALSGRVTASVQFEGGESLRPRSMRMALAPAGIASSEGELDVSGRLDARWSDGAVEWSLDGLEARADGAFGSWRETGLRTAERAGISLPRWAGAMKLELDARRVDGRLGARHPWPAEAQGDLAVEWRLGEAARGSLELSEARWGSPRAPEPGASTLAARITGSLGLAGPIRVTGQAATLGMDRLDAEFGLQLEPDRSIAGEGRAVFAGLKAPAMGVSTQRLDLRFTELHWPAGDALIEATTTGLDWKAEGARRSGADLDIKGKLEGAEILTGTGELLLGALHSLPFRLEARLADATANVRLEGAVLPAGAVPALARPLSVTLPRFLTFIGGEIHLDGEATLSGAQDGPGLRGRIEAGGGGLVLALGETWVEGLDLAAVLNLGDDLAGQGRLGIETVRTAAGLDFSDVASRFEFSGMERFDILDLGAGLLDGRLEADTLPVSGGRLGDATIRWASLDLGLLLAFLDVGGLDGTGRIDARFPLVTAEGGLEVRDGSFRAVGPGRIRYRAGAPAANIGMQALENFHFESLEGTVNYASDGSFTVGMDLLGSNPDLYGGHPIRFRLNIGGTLPEVFRSMFLTGDFERAIIEQLRSERGEGALRP